MIGGAVLILAACDRRPQLARPAPESCPSAATPISMEALHRSGGVPPRWRFTTPRGDAAAGRQAFVDFSCFSCHTVQGERFPTLAAAQHGVGPYLTGMGSHHPAEYFAESILNPDAVLVDGPGYIGPDGRSIMPTYGD